MTRTKKSTTQKRTSLSKRLRFEIFKRDSFTCQYCGESAPNVILHIDHIIPVSRGGDSNQLNLITSCQSCNSGKTNNMLSDDSTLNAQNNQLKLLQEKREQIEMMFKWRVGLNKIDDMLINNICSYWNKLTPGWVVGESGKTDIKKWLKKFTITDILSAMDVSAETYLSRDKDGKITQETIHNAFNKISGICYLKSLDKNNPELKELYYIRGIIRNKCIYYCNNAKILPILKDAIQRGVSIQELKTCAYTILNWSSFKKEIDHLINDHAGDRNG